MIRDYWRDPQFWVWWWRQRLPLVGKIAAAVVLIGGLGFGGFTAAGGLNSAVTTSSDEPPSPQVTTVRTLVTIREPGQVVTKPVRIVRTVAGRRSTTQVVLNTVTTPGRAYVVTRPGEVRTVPVVRRVVVRRDGRVQTVVRTIPGRVQIRTSVVTDQRTVTDERVLTNERVVTRDRVVTNTVPVTVRSTDTVRSTETVPVTVPVTIVETVQETVVETVPVTVTVTVRKD